MPLLIPYLQPSLSLRRALALGGVWVGTQALWLSEAYRLEFIGENVFLGLWVRALAYLIGNSWVVVEVTRSYTMRM
jgi:GPI mannosyltransferase 1 subunit M